MHILDENGVKVVQCSILNIKQNGNITVCYVKDNIKTLREVNIGLDGNINSRKMMQIKNMFKDKMIWITNIPNQKYNFSRLRAYLCLDNATEFTGKEIEIGEILLAKKILRKPFSCRNASVFSEKEYFQEF
jgi:hypothetical protein